MCLIIIECSLKTVNYFIVTLNLNSDTYKPQMFGSNSIKVKSINDWNKMIHKIHFSSELLPKRNEFIKLVKNTFVT